METFQEEAEGREMLPRCAQQKRAASQRDSMKAQVTLDGRGSGGWLVEIWTEQRYKAAEE